MNSFRVGMIGITVEQWGIGMAEGFLHEFQGWMVFMVSTALMLGEIALLNRMGRESGTWRQLFGVELPAPTPRGLPIQQTQAAGELHGCERRCWWPSSCSARPCRGPRRWFLRERRSLNFRCKSANGADTASRSRRFSPIN
jgi:hypothetical protein